MIRSLLSLTAVFMFTVSLLHAQECRDPTPQEKQAVEKFIKVLKEKLEAPILKSGWQQLSEKSALATLHVAKNPGPPRPLMSCATIWDLTLRAEPNSPRGQAMQAAAAKLGQSTSMDDIKKATAAMASAEMEIRAGENAPHIHEAHHPPVTKLDAPAGSAVAYRITKPGDIKQETVVCYGAFKPEITLADNNNFVLYPFVHPTGTSFIENMCVHITAVPEVADEYLKKLDWSQLNQALTK